MMEESQENSDILYGRGFQPINKSVDQSLVIVKNAMNGKRDVYPTKWKRLNKNLLGGLQPGKMYVIAGRPGVGKSAFSNQMIFDILDNNKDKQLLVLYWSFEMPGYQQILRAGAKSSNKEVSQLLSVFDHSRLILSGKDQELQKLNEVSKGCVWLQAKIGCINILLSQLNRNIEQEYRAKAQYQPLLTDLFGGDSIGQDAHVVMMLQRPHDLYGITDKYCGHDPIGLLAIHIEKNRDGLLGMIPYEAEMSTFTINERKK